MNPIIRQLFASFFLIAFASLQLKAQSPKPSTPAIAFSYTVQPQKFALEDRGDVKMMLTVTNETEETIDPETHLLRLMVNGEQSVAFMLTVGNGVREMKWFELPSGEELSRDLSVLAKAIFPEAGEYKMQLMWKGFATEEVLVEVTE